MDKAAAPDKDTPTQLPKQEEPPAPAKETSVQPSIEEKPPAPVPPPPQRNIVLLALVVIALGFIIAVLSFAKGRPAVTQTLKPQKLTPVSIQFSWFHTAEFVGFYVAKDKGYYRDAGLEVTFYEVELPTPPADQVAAGKAAFGVAGIDGVLLAREKGNKMVALAAIYQQSPVAFIVFKESGITKPEDFIGKRVTIECGSNAEYPQRAVLSKLKISSDQITEICSTYNIDQLLNDETDVFAGFVTNEPILLELQGHEINSILVTDYGVNFYANMIFTTEDMIKENPQIVQNFISATIKGYEYALANPEEGVQATLKLESGLGQLSEEHQRRTMAVQTPLIFSGKTPIGWMEDEIWEQGTQILLDQRILQGPVDFSEAYTNQFLPR